jgi:hypothetical protein
VIVFRAPLQRQKKEVVNSLSGITREMGKTRNEPKNLNKIQQIMIQM